MNETESKVLVCWREFPSVVKKIDLLAEERSVDRSDILRMVCRGLLRIEADSINQK